MVRLPALGFASCGKIPTKQATKINRVKPSKKERENGRDRDPQYATIYFCPPKAKMHGVTFHFFLPSKEFYIVKGRKKRGGYLYFM